MKKRKNILVCIDRDGTLDYDMRYHLGHQKNWKSKVHLLDNVIKGLKLLRKIPGVKIHMITNQTGVAIKDFPLLTLERAHEVCKFVMARLKDRSVGLDGYELCGKASVAYTKKRSKYKFHKNLVGNFSCFKPNPGMVNTSLKKEGWTKNNTNIYVIGDRISDVKCGINAGGYGILVPFPNRPEESIKVKKVKSKKKYVAKDFLDAVRFIRKKES